MAWRQSPGLSSPEHYLSSVWAGQKPLTTWFVIVFEGIKLVIDGFFDGEFFLICRIALFWNSFATVETYLLPIYRVILLLLGFLCGLAGKESACKVRSLGWEDPMEKGKATHSCILGLENSWTVQSMGSQRVRQDWVTLTFTLLHLIFVLVLSNSVPSTL